MLLEHFILVCKASPSYYGHSNSSMSCVTKESVAEIGLTSEREGLSSNVIEQAILTVVNLPLQSILFILSFFCVILMCSSYRTHYDYSNSYRALSPQWLCHSGACVYDHANLYRCLSPQRLCYSGQVSITEAMFFTSHVMTKISTSSKWCLLSSTPTLTIFDHFGLHGYLSGIFLHSTYEGSQLSSMV